MSVHGVNGHPKSRKPMSAIRDNRTWPNRAATTAYDPERTLDSARTRVAAGSSVITGFASL
jgi:hypothetical protein